MTRDNRDEPGARETERISADELETIRNVEEPRRGVALLVYHRDGVSFVPLLPDRPVVAGRDPPPGPGRLAIGDPSLSREHARFLLNGDTVEVVDLKSRNGTWFLGERVSRAEVTPGDEIRLSAVPVLVYGDARQRVFRGPLSHEGFRVALEDEVARARHFRRPFALLMFRAEGRPAHHVSGFHACISERLRPVDRIAFYSPETVEVLLPEAGLEDARQLADMVVSSARGRTLKLLAGIAVHPDAAAEPEALIEECRKALLSAGEAARVRVAATGARLSTKRGRGVPADEEVVVDGAAVRKVFDKVESLARSTIPVLILGETGVGKEVLAQRIHARSPRRNRPLVVVNCAAIPETLVEATLFGHQRGAFTGATHQQKGLFESADGGTLMLDEIGDLPKSSQAALLRVLETGRVRRVGAAEEIEVDVRIIAATHQDLEAMCARGEFRSDLLYRLSGVTVTIPPLRERTEEIELLTATFLKRANEVNGRAIAGLDLQAAALVAAYPWPGNLRELRNAIERAVVLTQSDVITVDDLPERLHSAAPRTAPPAPSEAPPTPQFSSSAASNEGGDLRSQTARFEAELIVAALNASGGNQKVAAERLGLPLRTLVHKLSTHGITRAPYVKPSQPKRRRS